MKVLNFAIVAVICVLMVGLAYADGGGGTYKVNKDGSITFIKGAEKVDEPQWPKLCKHENCSMIKVTANESLPIIVKKGYYGYAVAVRTGGKIVTANESLLSPFVEGGGGTYKINENGSIKFIKSAEKVDGPQWLKICKHENCSMRKFTANDSLPIVVNKGDYGYGAGKVVASNKINPFVGWIRYLYIL